MKKIPVLLSFCILLQHVFSQQANTYILIKPGRVFDGENMLQHKWVLVKNNMIDSVMEAGVTNIPPGTKVIDLPGTTLLPGLIEGHSHLFLHPYNETSWNDQVLKESRAERTARAVNHAKATLMAGFTTVRDLGTEGAWYDDVGLKRAIEKKVIPGPRMICATRAIVAKGTYGPRSDNPEVELPQGAAEVSNIDEMMKEVRTQISKGADLIKVYADYRWGKRGETMPTFSMEEMASAVQIAKSSGREVVAHASTLEGMRRAALAGVSTIEHGDGGDAEIFALMKAADIAYCPTLAATEAIQQYGGWKKNSDSLPPAVIQKRKTFAIALQSGVKICMGGDVGVFTHGDNAREMELMSAYGMNPMDVLRSATSVNADVFGYGKMIGRIKKGLFADIIAVDGDPSTNISLIRKIKLVMKDGTIYLP